MKVDTSEIEAFGRALADAGNADVWGDAAHDATVGEYQRQQSDIPRDKGALRKAILRKDDRKHTWINDGDSARLEIDLPQARYQGHNIPIPDAEPIAEAIAEAIDEHLTGA